MEKGCRRKERGEEEREGRALFIHRRCQQGPQEKKYKRVLREVIVVDGIKWNENHAMIWTACES